MNVFFMCQQPASEGGETPIADTRKVLSSIDPAILEKFRSKKVLYRRTFRLGTGLTWQTAFGAESQSAVEEYCARRSITCTWTEDGDLRTAQVRDPIAIHPNTGEEVWFNHATFFHISTLQPDVRKALLSLAGPDNLPANSYYGDGAEIEPETMDLLRDAYHKHTIVFPWRAGDMLALDNMLMCHGRRPFSGQRRVLVAMSEEYSPDSDVRAG
jgi:alpha-ketoglutarate-dependent taurine dioxygenase